MARPAMIARRPGRRALVPPSLTLALWRLRKMWRLLLAAELGIVAAVLLLCAVPLFARVATSAGLRAALAGAANNGDVASVGPGPGFIGPGVVTSGNGNQIVVIANTQQPSTQMRDAATPIVLSVMQQYLGAYLTGSPSFSVLTQPVPVQVPGQSSSSQSQLLLVGADLPATAAQYPLVSGRLPSANSTVPEIAMPEAQATALHIVPGTVLSLSLLGQSGQVATLKLHVVGILAPQPSGSPLGQGTVQIGGPSGPSTLLTGLVSNDALLTVLGGTTTGPPVTLAWTFTLDLSHITVDDLDHLTSVPTPLENAIQGQLSGVAGIQQAFADLGPIFTLSDFATRVALLQIPIVLLLLQVAGLVLIFVRLLADILVDRQAEAIAVLRSRGATRRQVFSALTLHGLAIGGIALVVGPLLAIPLVRLVASATLAPADRVAVDILAGNPFAVAWNVRWYALAAALVSVVAMIFSVNRAANANVLALRRESARTTNKPLWQRLNLDLAAAVIGLALYVTYVLIVGRVSNLAVRQALSPLALIFPLFLLFATGLLFVRFFPLVLRLGAWGAARVRGAAAMVALAQMARAPRQALRMTLLFALSTAFAIFVVVYVASASQRTQDVAAFLVGADFNGQVPSASGPPPTLAGLTAQYAALPGVIAASAGYAENINDQTKGDNIQLFAVDPSTYAATTIWSSAESSQPVGVLMNQLAASRASAIARDTVPAIVDEATAQLYTVSVGGRFVLPVSGYPQGQSMRFQVAAIVHYIPQVQGSAQYSNSGGVLVDEQTFAAVYATDTKATASALNTVWLRTTDDPAALHQIRAALATGPTQLTDLLDRRQLIADQQTDPLQISLLGVLGLGAALAVMLALVGSWLASWLNARARLTNFAVLRALGTTPRQTMRILLWEQGIVYVSALALGVALGGLLEQAVLPTMVFANLISGSAFNGRLNGLIDVPPVHAVVPAGTVAALLGVLVAACALALALMIVVISRASLGQSLRLNED